MRILINYEIVIRIVTLKYKNIYKAKKSHVIEILMTIFFYKIMLNSSWNDDNWENSFLIIW